MSSEGGSNDRSRRRVVVHRFSGSPPNTRLLPSEPHHSCNSHNTRETQTHHTCRTKPRPSYQFNSLLNTHLPPPFQPLSYVTPGTTPYQNVTLPRRIRYGVHDTFFSQTSPSKHEHKSRFGRTSRHKCIQEFYKATPPV